jgi:CRISPR-associated endonuclease Csy4
MKRYYFVISFLPDYCDVGLLAGRCISILHGFLSRQHRNDIGVCFPKWNEKSIGKQIAFICKDKGALKALRQQNYFEMMAHDKLFHKSEVALVPLGAKEVRFTREQLIGKSFMGAKRSRMKRAKKRAEARGEVYSPQYEVSDKDLPPFHSIPIASKSTQEDFILHVTLMSVDEIKTTFNSYGLATKKELGGTVPLLP